MVTTSPLLAGTQWHEQIGLEREAVKLGIQRYRQERRKSEGRGDAHALPPGQRWLAHWYLPVALEIRRTQAKLRRGQNAGPGHRDYGAVFLILSAKKLASIVMRVMFSRCAVEPEGVSKHVIVNAIGREVLAEAQMALWSKEKRTHLFKKLGHYQKKYQLTAEKVNWFAKINDENAIYDRAVLMHIGMELFWCVVKNACAGGYDEKPFKLAFHHKTVTKVDRHGRAVGRPKPIVYLDERVLSAVEKDHETIAHCRPVYHPMVVPPFKGQGATRAGYTELRTPVIANATREQRDALRDAGDKLDHFHECLASLGATPMRVNPEMAVVVAQLYKEGGAIAGLPHRFDVEPEPCPEEAEAKKLWKKEAAKIHSFNKKELGHRRLYEYLDGMTKAVRHWPKLYFPHKCDWRQRAYPIPMYLNHHGNDIPRGLLEFAEGVPCDSEGMKNVAIQAANFWKHGGLDKLPFDERIQWTYDNLAMILKSAEKPLDERWWLGAKKPFQFLAACMALRNPERAAHLMYGVDGTFNGLQNYSAISCDEVGARLSNLYDGERPNRPYNDIAVKVRGLLAASDHPLAQRLREIVDDDVVKQPAMTTVYGVTAIGAREQVYDQIKESGFQKDETFKASVLLANTTMEAIGTLFERARAYMEHLKKTAKTIAEDGHLVDWVTPLGFPVVQPYKRDRMATITTKMGRLRIRLDAVPPHPKKQSTACAPNFIHSVDSTHLFMTAHRCGQAGIAFAGVHDCYKTHAQHGNQLGPIARETFVTLHRDMRPLDMAVRYWRGKYPHLRIDDPPERGTFNVEEVLKSTYFFS
jgi:DNA-directed RNA polymerase